LDRQNRRSVQSKKDNSVIATRSYPCALANSNAFAEALCAGTRLSQISTEQTEMEDENNKDAIPSPTPEIARIAGPNCQIDYHSRERLIATPAFHFLANLA
jgi:hypothetical protein